MISFKALAGIVISVSLLSVIGCSKQEEAAVTAPEPAAVASEAPEAAPAAAPEGDRPRMSPEERAAMAKEQLEASAAAVFNTDPLIDPNTATPEQLAMIPGLSAEGAQAVIDGRPFATPSELNAAISEGMSEEDLFSVYSAMFVKVNLNSGANEDFRLVPSTLSARKLAHEFEEYRPYSSIEDFRREMKKYVSDQEVAFLERYVIVD